MHYIWGSTATPAAYRAYGHFPLRTTYGGRRFAFIPPYAAILSGKVRVIRAKKPCELGTSLLTDLGSHTAILKTFPKCGLFRNMIQAISTKNSMVIRGKSKIL